MENNEFAWIDCTASGAAEPVTEEYIPNREMSDEWEAQMMYSDQGSHPSER